MKQCKVFLVLAVMLALASPAFAEFKLNGYYRVTGVAQTIKSISDNPKAESMIDQRLRMKLTDSLNDFVSVVYYGEVDTPWGEQSKGNIGGGGKLGTDGVNIETKNAYVDFKVPDSSWKIRTGLQGIADNFSGMVIDEDAAALTAGGDLAGVPVTLIYSKFDEGIRNTWDDVDFYGLQVQKGLGEQLKLGADIYLLDDNSAEQEIYYYGVTGDYRVGDLGFYGFVVMQDGSADKSGPDSQAIAASVKAAMVVPKGDVGLRAIYVSADDSATDDDRWQTGIGEWEFPGENLMIFLPDKWVNNSGHPDYAIEDGAKKGYGLLGLVATANLKGLPMGLYTNLGLGAFMAADDTRNGNSASHVDGTLVDNTSDVRAGSMMGMELAARVGKVFADKFDLSLRGAYASFGDFYDDTVDNNGTVTDPDAVYKLALMANVSF